MAANEASWSAVGHGWAWRCYHSLFLSDIPMLEELLAGRTSFAADVRACHKKCTKFGDHSAATASGCCQIAKMGFTSVVKQVPSKKGYPVQWRRLRWHAGHSPLILQRADRQWMCLLFWTFHSYNYEHTLLGLNPCRSWSMNMNVHLDYIIRF